MSTGAQGPQGPQGRPPTARGARLPAHVDADLRARPVVRAVCRVAARASGDADVVLVVPRGRAPLPDGLAGAAETARAHVALVSRARAVEIATARSSEAAARVASAPPAGARWVLYLDTGARCTVVPFAVPDATGGDALVTARHPVTVKPDAKGAPAPSEPAPAAPPTQQARERVETWRTRNNADRREHAGTVRCADGTTVRVEALNTPQGATVRVVQVRRGVIIGAVTVDVPAAAGLVMGLCELLERAHKVDA